MFPTKMSMKNAKISPQQLSMKALQNVSNKKSQIMVLATLHEKQYKTFPRKNPQWKFMEPF